MELQQGTWLTEGEVEGEVTFPRSHRDWWTTDPQTWQGATSSSSLTPIPNSIPESCPTPQPSPRPPFWEELYLPGCWRYCCFQTPASPRWRQTRMSVPGRSRPGHGTAGHRVPCRGTQTWPGSRSGCTWPAGMARSFSRRLPLRKRKVMTSAVRGLDFGSIDCPVLEALKHGQCCVVAVFAQ